METKIFRACFGMALAVMVLGAAAAEGAFEDYFDQSFPLAAGGSVSIENVNGDVTIEVWDRDEVRVQAVKSASSTELLEGLKIEIDASDSSVRIETDYPSTRWSRHEHGEEHGQRQSTSMQVEYTLTVPRSAAVDDVDLVNGSLSVDGVEGGVAAETVNGQIVVRRAAGGFELSTVNGGIELYAELLGRDERVVMESVNGTLDLYLDGSVGADIEAESVNGKLRNDFGIEVRKGKYVGSDFSGSVGGGGSRVSLETVNGSIAVHSR
jgi:DUF4097 and DUF4098 domain-containing protein YvlB